MDETGPKSRIASHSFSAAFSMRANARRSGHTQRYVTGVSAGFSVDERSNGEGSWR